MTIRSEDVKALRADTGVGIMDCKNALTKAEGDIERAKKILREEGLALLSHTGRATTEGRVEAYVHHSGKVGVLLEVACNTDFAANSDDFRGFMLDVAMHIAANKPRYIIPEDVPEETIETEKEIYRKQMEKEGKPAEMIGKIVEGRIKKFHTETCLLKQTFVKDPAHTIEDLLADLRSKTGENITIKRFVRYEIGEQD
ncbi:translation elongation factor Ts [Candidatus Bipolaricaulota bacterium]|nr:translation elongation factor Ts [Candidatus Bipolaricaulota bacterium]